LLLGIIVLPLSLTLTAHATLTVSGSGLSGSADVAVDGSGAVTIGTTSATGVTIGQSGRTVTLQGNLATSATTTTANLVISGFAAGTYCVHSVNGVLQTTVSDCGSGSGGISSLNGLTGATQTFATASSGSIFTITSSGTAHTFTFPATPSFASLTLGNPLTVANGGIGQSSLTANVLLLGNGTNALATVSPGRIYQVLQSNGSAAPSFVDIASLITAGTNLTKTGTSTLAVISSPTFSGNLTVNGTTTLATTTITGTLSVGQAGTTTGQLLLAGATSGTVTLQASSTAGNLTLTLPSSPGTAGQALLTDGSGNLYFGNASSSQWTSTSTGISYSGGNVTIGATPPSGAPAGTIASVAEYVAPVTVANLPAASTSNKGVVRTVSDGQSSSDCTVGGGSTLAFCVSNGTAWTAFGGGGGTWGTITGTLSNQSDLQAALNGKATADSRPRAAVINKHTTCAASATCEIANIHAATATAVITSGAVVPTLVDAGEGYITSVTPAVIVSGVTCTVAPSLAATVQAAPDLTTQPQASTDFGKLTGFVGSGGSGCTGTPTITIAAPAPGNVADIQWNAAGSVSGGTANDGVIRVTIDGVAQPDIPTGLFFGMYGNGSPSGGAYTQYVLAPRFRVQALSSAIASAEAQHNIPFTSSLKIQWLNTGSGASTVYLYSSVEYFLGTPAAGVYPATDKVWHAQVIPLTTIAHYASVDLLPQINGTGRVAHMQFYLQGGSSGSSNPYWLEASPVVYLDGQPFAAPGGEDFFGGRFYFSNVPASNGNLGDNVGVSFSGSTLSSSKVAENMFRWFDRDSLNFASTLRIRWTNGMAAVGDPGTVTYGVFLTYFTTQ
jgi:hypothetical protein